MGNYGKTKQTAQRQCAKDWNLEITKLWVAHTLAKEESQKNLYCSPEWKKQRNYTQGPNPAHCLFFKTPKLRMAF